MDTVASRADEAMAKTAYTADETMDKVASTVDEVEAVIESTIGKTMDKRPQRTALPWRFRGRGQSVDTKQRDPAVREVAASTSKAGSSTHMYFLHACCMLDYFYFSPTLTQSHTAVHCVRA